MRSFISVATVLGALLGHVALAQIDLCSDSNPKLTSSVSTGVAVPNIQYDNWLRDSPQIATSLCQNHVPFFSNNNDKFVHLTYPAFTNSEACGACVNVTGANGNSLILTVIGAVNRVNGGDIEVSQSVATQLSDGLGSGQSPAISYRFVQCPATVVSGNIRYRFSESSNSESASLQISNYNIPLRKVIAAEHELARQAGGPFGSELWTLRAPVNFPLTVEVFSVTNEKVTFRIGRDSQFTSNYVDTSVQFQGQCIVLSNSQSDSGHASTILASFAVVGFGFLLLL